MNFWVEFLFFLNYEFFALQDGASLRKGKNKAKREPSVKKELESQKEAVLDGADEQMTDMTRIREDGAAEKVEAIEQIADKSKKDVKNDVSKNKKSPTWVI